MNERRNPMMSTQNKTFGQQFLEVLKVAKNDKSKMFMLLRSTLEKINPFPSEKVNFSAVINQVTSMESIAAMKAAKAGFNARHGAYMFAEDYIYLSAKVYKDLGLGDIKAFKRDFSAFVQSENTPTRINVNEAVRAG